MGKESVVEVANGRLPAIGFILPSGNQVFETDLRWNIPTDVEVRVARARMDETTAQNVRSLGSLIDGAADELTDAGSDAVVLACTSGSLAGGKGYDGTIAERLRERTGRPATTTATAVVRRLKQLNVSCVSVLTPYLDEVNDLVGVFLESNGFVVTHIEGRQLRTGGEIGSVTPFEIACDIERVSKLGADAVFVSCTAYRGMQARSMIGGKLGPIVTSNEATIRDALALTSKGTV